MLTSLVYMLSLSKVENSSDRINKLVELKIGLLFWFGKEARKHLPTKQLILYVW